ncbi:MAG: TlpA disulfide reductase family protein [Cytophagales bacterium]|jgi:thiol-disulfide isomerase/thioredoxin|nr:TlpA disulfide reductase family protein [Cytophagales bacterium]
MRNTLIILFTLLTSGLLAQNKNTIFYDSVGQVTSWEGHWAQVVTGRYKSIYNKSENKKTLVKMTRQEFDTELRKTEKKITKTNKLGTDFPEFDLLDINGNRLTRTELKGKVLVLNFWFIGCSPCEMERPSLNDLTKVYADNKDVVFISFAKNDKEQLTKFLAENPILYNVVPTDKDFIKTQFEINEYPVNIILDRNGKYFFNSSASGVGILTILQRQIDKALKG